MHLIGPKLEELLRHLADTPRDFLADPRLAHQGGVHVDAVVQDLLALLDQRSAAEALRCFGHDQPLTERNRLIIVLLLCWLLHYPWFRQQDFTAARILELLQETAPLLASQVTAAKLLDDPDRREELVRLTLAHFDYRPAGESESLAKDRLTSLSSIERARVLEASRAAQQRARELREALQRQRAQEAADKWTRE